MLAFGYGGEHFIASVMTYTQYHVGGIGSSVSGNEPVETVSLWNDWLVRISEFKW